MESDSLTSWRSRRSREVGEIRVKSSDLRTNRTFGKSSRLRESEGLKVLNRGDSSVIQGQGKVPMLKT